MAAAAALCSEVTFCRFGPYAGPASPFPLRWYPGSPILLPITSRSAPAALSMALDTSCDFGNPDPYSHMMLSRISNPASSIATAKRCQVRVPPKASRCPPGFRTRKHSSAQYLPGGNASHFAPINPNPYGGSVTIASTLFSGMLRITSIQSP